MDHITKSIIEMDMGYEDIDKLDPGPNKAMKIAEAGLFIDGDHHKQWHLEQILVALGVDLDKYRDYMLQNDYDWEDGVIP